MPSAEIQVGRHGRDRDHVHVLGEEEEREAHARVLGVVPGHELLLGLRKVERRAVGLGDARGHEDEEAHRLQEHEPLRDEPEPVARLRVDQVDQRQRVAEHEHRRQRHAVAQLVADHLRRGAQAAEQRVLVVRAPARQHDAVDAHRGDGEDDQHRDVDVRHVSDTGRSSSPNRSSAARTARRRTRETPSSPR